MADQLWLQFEQFREFVNNIPEYFKREKGQIEYLTKILRRHKKIKPLWYSNQEIDEGFIFESEPVPSEHPNVTAVKHAIALCEGTDLNLDSERTGYDVRYAYAQPPADISPGSDHPRVVNQGGGYRSNASGRYQFMSFTWDEYARGADFTPSGQETVCTRLLYEKRKVGQLIEQGKLKEAMRGLSLEWASIPVGPLGIGQKLENKNKPIADSEDDGQYGQPTKTWEQFKGYYLAVGGKIAA